MRLHRRFLGTDIGVVAAVVLATVLFVVLDSGSTGDYSTVAAVVTVEPSGPGRAIPDGFLGLSLEYTAIEAYAGTDPTAVNPVLVQLIRNLSPGQRAALRIGGDTTDSTWWPVPGLARPPGVTYSLTAQWLQVAHSLAAALRARVIAGVNLEADRQLLAANEAQALLDGIGRHYVEALELGNEPALYSLFTWYRTAAGHQVKGRGHGYDFAGFVRDFTQISASLPNVPLAGPALNDSGWISRLRQFLAAEPRVKVVTVHRYPLQVCFVRPGSPQYPTLPHLISRTASAGLAERLAPVITAAHARGLPLRLDEINTVACGAKVHVSRTFAAALWSLDVLFQLARAGVDGVNFHTFPGAGYNLFSFIHSGGRWSGSVAPGYYGMLMFAEAAPHGARLVRASGSQPSWLRSWATRSRAGTIRVVLINTGSAPRLVSVAIRGSSARATLVRLTAPSLDAPSGITLGGRSFDAPTNTGKLAGHFERVALERSGGRYLVPMPPYSAALITVR
ncbi:MAG: glycosyl hydrolase family 79 C-terminal domain-containing protein [Actinomycetota bacterium]|nr:glycosyl hydrolase family 79 C-terminal domain-containing protein [Actinomycetota bacterium]